MRIVLTALALGLVMGGAGIAAPSSVSGNATSAERVFAFPAPPAEKKTGLRGAFLRADPASTAPGLPSRNEVWVFTRNGRFSKSPRGGFDEEDLANATQARRTEGTYWLDGNKVVLAWADGSKPTEFAFERRGDDLVIGPIGSTPSAPRVTIQRRGGRELTLEGVISKPLEAFKRGWRCDGVYEKAAPEENPWDTISLSKDGTFVLRSQNVTVETITGTYDLDGYTAKLTDQSGGTQALTVFASGQRDDSGRPDFIWSDGDIWIRQTTP